MASVIGEVAVVGAEVGGQSRLSSFLAEACVEHAGHVPLAPPSGGHDAGVDRVRGGLGVS